MFRASSDHLQEDTVVYMQRMVLSLSTVHSCRGKVVGGCLKTPTNNLPPTTPTNNLPPTVSSHSSCVPTGHHELS